MKHAFGLQVEVKVIPHCPFWAFPIVNAVSKKSSLSHPFDGFPHVNARFTECFFITYDLEIVEIIAFCWWAAILLNAKRYSRKIISAWQRCGTRSCHWHLLQHRSSSLIIWCPMAHLVPNKSCKASLTQCTPALCALQWTNKQ
jgi:hypothetical protein